MPASPTASAVPCVRPRRSLAVEGRLPGTSGRASRADRASPAGGCSVGAGRWDRRRFRVDRTGLGGRAAGLGRSDGRRCAAADRLVLDTPHERASDPSRLWGRWSGRRPGSPEVSAAGCRASPRSSPPSIQIWASKPGPWSPNSGPVGRGSRPAATVARTEGVSGPSWSRTIGMITSSDRPRRGPFQVPGLPGVVGGAGGRTGWWRGRRDGRGRIRRVRIGARGGRAGRGPGPPPTPVPIRAPPGVRISRFPPTVPPPGAFWIGSASAPVRLGGVDRLIRLDDPAGDEGIGHPREGL